MDWLKELIHRKLFWLILAALILAGGLVYWLARPTASPPAKQHTVTRQTTPGATNTITLTATGDWIAHDSINTAAKQSDGTYNYLPLISDELPSLKRGDVRFCNDPILNGGENLGIHGYPKFNSPTEFVTDIAKSGCNLINDASNHSFDFTQTNIDNSVAAWAAQPNMLAVAGENRSQAEHDTVHYFTIKGVKFAFLAYTTYSNNDAPTQNNYGVNIFSTAFAGSQIQQAKASGAQFIIASMRWGTEYSTAVNAEQKSDAQWLADQGVNLVLGHGSHELQPVAQLTGSGGNKTLVWYSLGNFLNTQEPPETLFNGIAAMDIDTHGLQISNLRYLPIYMHYEWTAAQAKADDIAARTNVHLYLLDQATPAMLAAQQLNTTIDAQKQRLTSTLNANGLQIPLVSASQF